MCKLKILFIVCLWGVAGIITVLTPEEYWPFSKRTGMRPLTVILWPLAAIAAIPLRTLQKKDLI